MRIDIEMPVVFRAWPKRAKSEKSVFCKETFRADVADVSFSDTEVVIEAEASERTKAFSMRAYDGALYRKIVGSVREAEDRRLFSDPFSVEDKHALVTYAGRGWYRPLADCGGAIYRNVGEDVRPVAKPLTDQFQWQLARDSGAGDLNTGAWPPSRGPCATAEDVERRRRTYTAAASRESGMDGIHRHRNGVTLDAVFADLRDVNDLDIAISRELHAKRADAVLLIDGEVWMRSAPLAHRIDFFIPDNDQRPRVIVTMETAPEGYAGHLFSTFYGLHDEDHAMAEADRLRAILDKNRRRKGVDYSRPAAEIVLVKPAFHVSRDALLHYDHDRERVRRFGYTAAVECGRLLERWPSMKEKVDAVEIALVEEARAAVGTSNYVTGEHSDMGDYVQPLAAIWKKLGHPQQISEYTGVWSIELELPRVLASLEDIPISLDVPAFSV